MAQETERRQIRLIHPRIHPTLGGLLPTGWARSALAVWLGRSVLPSGHIRAALWSLPGGLFGLTPVLFKLPIPSSRSLVPTGYGYVLPEVLEHNAHRVSS
jgi:hypothetical protein